jgi:coproporphyrinogen III oxidase-like Fe-S oxidoreductase
MEPVVLSSRISAKGAFDLAQKTLTRMGLPERLSQLHEAGVSIRRSVLGGSHSVAVYPPINSLTPADGRDVVGALDCGPDVSLYVHVAFCETRCTFCHYTVQNYSGAGRSAHADLAVSRYVEALRRELAAWGDRLARSGTALSSIYIGGGTPLVLDSETLAGLLALIQERFSILPGAEICIEGSPLTITAPDGPDKLWRLKGLGVTRLSFGVQSFDDSVLKYAARGYTHEVPVRAAEIVGAIFDNWNIDLIQGLYRGSPQETWTNLEAIARLRPPHLTWYHARFSDRPQGAWYNSADRHAAFEEEPDLLLGRTLIWQGMTRLGYQRIDGNRFVRERRYIDPFKSIRTSASRNLLGVGAGAYSHIAGPGGDDRWGMIFRNSADIPTYVARVLKDESPIATARCIDDTELLAASYATGLRGGRVESRDVCEIGLRLPRLAAHYSALVERLRSLGVLEDYVDAYGREGLRLTELGRLFEDETLALFFSPAVQKALVAPARSARAAAPVA